MIDEIAAAAASVDRVARVHLKVDTGLSRAGAVADDWPDLVDAALRAQADGVVNIVGLWSHLVHGSDPRHPTTGLQVAAFSDAVDYATRAGVSPEVRHLANSGGLLLVPGTRFDLVRAGLAIYGLSPVPDERDAAALGLRPAMTLTARLALTKKVPAGTGVSYGHRYITPAATTLGLVPLGYADGIGRSAANKAEVLVRGRSGDVRRTIAGTVCMDQFVLDLGGADDFAAGDEVVLFGPGDRGEPTAQDWADALDTISYEIVTRIGVRVPRVYEGALTASGRSSRRRCERASRAPNSQRPARTSWSAPRPPAGAAVLLVGEAPGATEDATGLPFVGRAGALLDQLLGEVGLPRPTVAVANVLKCRPPGNRAAVEGRGRSTAAVGWPRRSPSSIRR